MITTEQQSLGHLKDVELIDAAPNEEGSGTREIVTEAQQQTSTFYRITLGSLCFGALVGYGFVVSVAPVAGKWRGQTEAAFLAHYRGRGARIERVDAAGQAVQS